MLGGGRNFGAISPTLTDAACLDSLADGGTGRLWPCGLLDGSVLFSTLPNSCCRVVFFRLILCCSVLVVDESTTTDVGRAPTPLICSSSVFEITASKNKEGAAR